MKVDIKTSGRKGETYKQIVLQANPSIEGATPDKVLSEGEKRAVALADFLTEVALDDSSSTIVLDDPVTSLDLEWRETISEILAEEAINRQVILFTHDLPFLYYLKKNAENHDIEVATHWVKRGDLDGKPGYVYLDNSPALEKDYRTSGRARKMLDKARGSDPEEQQVFLRQGYAALRSTYEAFIVFGLFNNVVNRFEPRISFLRLDQVFFTREILETVQAKCEELSRYIEAHLHSDMIATEPTCENLLSQIEEFDALKSEHKRLRRAALANA